MDNNTKTTNITLNITCSFNFDIEVKDGKVSWEDVYDKLNEIEGKFPEGVNIQDWDDYYLGREILESDLDDEGIKLED
jgi:hypothetical protein